MPLQKSERCATHSSLFRPQDAVAVRAPAGGAKLPASIRADLAVRQREKGRINIHKISIYKISMQRRCPAALPNHTENRERENTYESKKKELETAVSAAFTYR